MLPLNRALLSWLLVLANGRIRVAIWWWLVAVVCALRWPAGPREWLNTSSGLPLNRALRSWLRVIGLMTMTPMTLLTCSEGRIHHCSSHLRLTISYILD